MDAGQTGVIEHVGDRIREHVIPMGVRPGRQLEFHTKHPFNGPVVVSVGNSMTSLSREYARDIRISLE
ncbi:MAG: FeoA family protein [Halodesulfurarchaeum sp.]